MLKFAWKNCTIHCVCCWSHHEVKPLFSFIEKHNKKGKQKVNFFAQKLTWCYWQLNKLPHLSNYSNVTTAITKNDPCFSSDTLSEGTTENWLSPLKCALPFCFKNIFRLFCYRATIWSQFPKRDKLYSTISSTWFLSLSSI